MESGSAQLANRLRQSLRKLLVWAEAYQPRDLSERRQYDSELDEAEDLLEAADRWAARVPDQVDAQAGGGGPLSPRS